MRGAFHIGAALAVLPIVAVGAMAASRGPAEDAQCSALRRDVLPVGTTAGADVSERADLPPEVPFRAFVSHRFRFTRLRGGHEIGFVFFSGEARYRRDGRVSIERVPAAIAGDSFFDEREWRFVGRLSDIDTNSTLQMDPVVSGMSAALAYMAVGPAMDAAFRDASGRIRVPWPVIRGTVGFRYWYTCQGCAPGASGLAGGQDLSSARFVQRGDRTFVITNAPRVMVAELGATGQPLRYFRCSRPVA